jgi:hypothetical protein
MSNAINSLVDKANRARFKLWQYNLRDNVLVAFQLFNSLITPIYSYACGEVWAPFETKASIPITLLSFVKLALLKN